MAALSPKKFWRTFYFNRNPALTRTRGSDEFLGRPDDDLNAAIEAAIADTGANSPKAMVLLVPSGTLAKLVVDL